MCRKGCIDVGFISTYARYSYLHLIWLSSTSGFSLCEMYSIVALNIHSPQPRKIGKYQEVN